MNQECRVIVIFYIDFDPGIHFIYQYAHLSHVCVICSLGYPRITTAPPNKVVRENSSILFPCVIEGTPTPHVEWTTPNGTIFTVLPQPSGTIRVLSNNSLHITMVTESDAGRYICKAVNNIGERSVSAMLTVQSEFFVWSELRYLYKYQTCKLKLYQFYSFCFLLLITCSSVISPTPFRTPIFILNKTPFISKNPLSQLISPTFLPIHLLKRSGKERKVTSYN